MSLDYVAPYFKNDDYHPRNATLDFNNDAIKTKKHIVQHDAPRYEYDARFLTNGGKQLTNYALHLTNDKLKDTLQI